MFYVVLILVIGMVLAPIVYLKPNPRQKQQMALRQKAHSLGMQVKLCPMPSRDKAEAKVANAMAYRLLRPDNKNQPRICFNYQLGRGVTDEQQWYLYKTDSRPSMLLVEELMPLLAQLPLDVRAVESTPQWSAVFWHESGDEQTVERIADILAAIQQQELEFIRRS